MGPPPDPPTDPPGPPTHLSEIPADTQTHRHTDARIPIRGKED